LSPAGPPTVAGFLLPALQARHKPVSKRLELRLHQRHETGERCGRSANNETCDSFSPRWHLSWAEAQWGSLALLRTPGLLRGTGQTTSVRCSRRRKRGCLLPARGAVGLSATFTSPRAAVHGVAWPETDGVHGQHLSVGRIFIMARGQVRNPAHSATWRLHRAQKQQSPGGHPRLSL